MDASSYIGLGSLILAFTLALIGVLRVKETRIIKRANLESHVGELRDTINEHLEVCTKKNDHITKINNNQIKLEEKTQQHRKEIDKLWEEKADK